GLAQDPAYLQAWAMATEFERRFEFGGHPGAARLLAFLNRANMGSYRVAVEDFSFNADIILTREYRYKYSFGLNLEQELTKGIGTFLRLGWSDGQSEAWMFSDMDHAASLGLSVKGECWQRPEDVLDLTNALNNI